MSFFDEIDLPARANLRDAGGRRTRRGATLARGLLYRGAEQCACDAAVHARLVETLGIRRVIDLRMDSEIREAGAPPGNPGCERVHLPLFRAVLPTWGNPLERTPPATARRYYEMLLEGRRTLARIVGMLAEPQPKATLIHCVAGRDRTGIVVACLLDLLDVPETAIAEDYALSAVMDDAEGRNADPANILGLFDLVRAEHGSTREMLLEAGLPPASLDDLQRAFVAAP